MGEDLGGPGAAAIWGTGFSWVPEWVERDGVGGGEGTTVGTVWQGEVGHDSFCPRLLPSIHSCFTLEEIN